MDYNDRSVTHVILADYGSAPTFAATRGRSYGQVNTEVGQELMLAGVCEPANT